MECTIWDLLRAERCGPPYEPLKSDSRDDFELFLEQDRAGTLEKFLKVEFIDPEDLNRVRRMAAGEKEAREQRRLQRLKKDLVPEPPPPERREPPPPPAPPAGAIMTNELAGRIVCRFIPPDPGHHHGETYVLAEATPEVRQTFPCADYYQDLPPRTNDLPADQRWQGPFLGLCLVLGLAEEVEVEQVDAGNTTVYHPRTSADFWQTFRIKSVPPGWRPAPWYLYESVLEHTVAFAKSQRMARASLEAGPVVAERLEALSERRGR